MRLSLTASIFLFLLASTPVLGFQSLRHSVNRLKSKIQFLQTSIRDEATVTSAPNESLIQQNVEDTSTLTSNPLTVSRQSFENATNPAVPESSKRLTVQNVKAISAPGIQDITIRSAYLPTSSTTPTPSLTEKALLSSTPTPTRSPNMTPASSATSNVISTPTSSATSSVTPTPTPSNTKSVTPTSTSSATASISVTSTASITPTPSSSSIPACSFGEGQKCKDKCSDRANELIGFRCEGEKKCCRPGDCSSVSGQECRSSCRSSYTEISGENSFCADGMVCCFSEVNTEETSEASTNAEDAAEKCEDYGYSCQNNCAETNTVKNLICPSSKVCCSPEEGGDTCSGELTSCKAEKDCGGTILTEIECENGLFCCEEDECVADNGLCKANCGRDEVEVRACASGAKCCLPEEQNTRKSMVV